MDTNRTAQKRQDPTLEMRPHETGTPRFDDLPDVLCFRDLYAFLPIGRNALYEALQSQRIRNVRIGTKYLVPKAALRDFLDGENKTTRLAGTPFEGDF